MAFFLLYHNHKTGHTAGIGLKESLLSTAGHTQSDDPGNDEPH